MSPKKMLKKDYKIRITLPQRLKRVCRSISPPLSSLGEKVWTNKRPAACNTKGHLHMLFKRSGGVWPGTAVKKSEWEEGEWVSKAV